MRYLILIAVAACGYPEFEDVGVDAPRSDAGGCPAPTSYGSPTIADQGGAFFSGGGTNPDQLVYAGRMTNDNPADALWVGLVSGGGAFPSGFVAKTIQLAGPELNFGTCSACVVVAANCVNCSPVDTVGTGDYYMATAGQLNITAVSQTQIKGTLTNVTFQHVTIENAGSMPTLISHPAADGCATKIASAAFDAAVTTQ